MVKLRDVELFVQSLGSSIYFFPALSTALKNVQKFSLQGLQQKDDQHDAGTMEVLGRN